MEKLILLQKNKSKNGATFLLIIIAFAISKERTTNKVVNIYKVALKFGSLCD